MPQRLTQIGARRISFVNRAAVRDPANPSQPRRFVLFKAEDAPTSTEGVDDVTTIAKDDLDPTVREALEKAEKDAAEAVEKATKAEADRDKAQKERDEAMKKAETEETPPVPAAIDKSELSPEVRAIVEKAENDTKAANERITKAEETAANAEKLAKAEVTRREIAEFVAKAETGEYRGLPGSPAEVGAALHALSKADPEAFATLEKSVLTPGAAQLSASVLLKEQGRGGEGAPPDSAVAKFEAQVVELTKADTSLSKTAAKERVMREQPDLAKAMNAELRGVPLTDASAWGK